jgi:hypothetical protein
VREGLAASQVKAQDSISCAQFSLWCDFQKPRLAPVSSHFGLRRRINAGGLWMTISAQFAS